MKNIFLKISMLLLFVTAGVSAQDYTRVDKIVKAYPKSYKTTSQLAQRIASDFHNQEDRARALFTWIAYNISYDESPAALGRKPIKFSYSNQAERAKKIAEIENKLAEETLRRGKGVCHGYSMVYALTARKLGMDSEVVHGNAKALPTDIGKLPTNSNHAWNTIKVNGQWKLVDVTWGSGGFSGGSRKFGFRFDDRYFFTDPDVFFLNHFPDDKKWLLTSKSAHEYAALPLYYDLGYELISPNSGVIKSGRGGALPFRIKGLKATDEVAYQYTSSPFSNKVAPKIVNGVGEFNVLLDKAARGTLTIFVNRESVAAYSIQR